MRFQTFSFKSKNAIILGQPGFQILAIRVQENAVVLA